MSDNVVVLPLITRINSDPERLLEAAKSANLKGVVIIGWTDEGDGGEAEYMASSIASGPEVLWLMERLKTVLLNSWEDDE
jgi:hypothetical protein